MTAPVTRRLLAALTLVALAVLAAACATDPVDDGARTAARATGQPEQPATTASAPGGDTDPATDTTEASTPAESTTTTTAPLSPAELPPPGSAAEFIAAIDEAELAVRDPDLTAAELDAWGRRQQRLYRVLAANDGWVPEVLAGADPAIRDAVAGNWDARTNLTSLIDTEELHDELPAWRVVDPLPAETLLAHYRRGEAEWGIAWEFLAAINLVETRMGRIQGVSTAGALGPMQFLPTTWAECCDGDPTNPADAIVGAAKYLTIRGGPENMPKALWGYNNSDYYVNAVTAYAEVMMADERAYHGYHAWEIYFRSTEGLIRIPVGYEQAAPIPAADWLADHPEDLLSADDPAEG
ncbi:MAG: lytic transglycosylase domain-containing protein [Actinomycetota bacterium]